MDICTSLRLLVWTTLVTLEHVPFNKINSTLSYSRGTCGSFSAREDPPSTSYNYKPRQRKKDYCDNMFHLMRNLTVDFAKATNQQSFSVSGDVITDF